MKRVLLQPETHEETVLLPNLPESAPILLKKDGRVVGMLCKFVGAYHLDGREEAWWAPFWCMPGPAKGELTDRTRSGCLDRLVKNGYTPYAV